MIRIERYKVTRHWAIWQDNTLLAIVCSKKGANAIKQIIEKKLQHRPPAKPLKAFKGPSRIKPRRIG